MGIKNEFLEWTAEPLILQFAGALAIIIFITLIRRSINKMIMHKVKNTDTRYRSRKMLGMFSFAITSIVLIVIFSSELGNLSVAFGVAGAGIAFALQEVIASIAGWIAISFGGFYAVGNRVQLGGIKGDVIDISVLRTTLMEVGEWVKGDLYSGRVVRVANSFVFKEPVFNYSGDFPFLWDEISLPIRYGSDWKQAREILEKIGKENLTEHADLVRHSWHKLVALFRIEEANIDPIVTMQATDNWIEMTLRYVVDYRQRRSTKDLLFMKILEEIDATAGKVQIASATFELVRGSTLEISTANKL